MENVLLLVLLIKNVLRQVFAKGSLTPDEKSQILRTIFQLSQRQFKQEADIQSMLPSQASPDDHCQALPPG